MFQTLFGAFVFFIRMIRVQNIARILCFCRCGSALSPCVRRLADFFYEIIILAEIENQMYICL